MFLKTTFASLFLAVLFSVGCAAPQVNHAPADSAGLGAISYDVELNSSFDAAIERTLATLKKEGFGQISRIDLHKAFKEKLGVEMAPHTILGVCNPKLAYKAVTAMPEAALMLPCNVTVQQLDANRVMVRIINPQAVMASAGMESNAAVKAVGTDANEGLKRVAASLAQPAGS
jgi:uncharacterized protein (DUF302 family)